MRKVKRRRGRSPPVKTERREHDPSVGKLEVEEVFPPPNQRMFGDDEAILTDERQNPFANNKAHRCTYYKPSNEDFGQLTDKVLPPDDYYQKLLQEICYDPNSPDTALKGLRNACQGSKVETCSRFLEPGEMKLDDNADLLDDDAQWQTIDSVSEVDMFLPDSGRQEQSEQNTQSHQNRIRISETPRVKRIAEKFSKFKRNNVEVRRLEERVVCLEYDIFDLDADPTVPLQKMRAFFSIKTKEIDENDNENITNIPSGVKRNFNIKDKDLQKLNKKEIEIIDGEIPENRSILEDLKRVLRRKKALNNKKRQQTLDLMCLYEMAKRESPPVNHDYSNTNLLSKAELQEIKDLILSKCASSVHRINRRTVQCKENAIDDAKCEISGSLISELMRERDKL